VQELAAPSGQESSTRYPCGLFKKMEEKGLLDDIVTEVSTLLLGRHGKHQPMNQWILTRCRHWRWRVQNRWL